MAPIGPKASASDVRRLTPVAPVAAVQNAQPSHSEAARAASATGLQALSQPAAASAPVDVARVAQARKAIADGSFSVAPAAIADRLLALKHDWTSNDPA